MTAGELLEKAAACKTCGKVHAYYWIGKSRASWASPDDGHDYVPVVQPETVALLRFLATGKYENPWTPQEKPRCQKALSS